VHFHPNLIVATVKHLVQGHRQIVWPVSYEWADFYGPLCTRKRPPFPHFSAEMLRKSIPFPIVLMQALLIYLLDFLCINYKAGSIKNMGTRHQDKHKSSASEFLAWARKVFLSFVFFSGQQQRRKIEKHFSPCESFWCFYFDVVS